MADRFVRLSDVFDGPWTGGAECVCADCGHVGQRHSAETRGACDVAGCPCGEFALWKGDKPGANVRRFSRLLDALGPEGERVRLLWSKARPSAVEFVADLRRGELGKWVRSLRELAERPESARARGLAVVVHWTSCDERPVAVYVPAWRVVHEAGAECACCADGVSAPPGEAFFGLWSPGAGGVQS